MEHRAPETFGEPWNPRHEVEEARGDQQFAAAHAPPGAERDLEPIRNPARAGDFHLAQSHLRILFDFLARVAPEDGGRDAVAR